MMIDGKPSSTEKYSCAEKLNSYTVLLRDGKMANTSSFVVVSNGSGKNKSFALVNILGKAQSGGQLVSDRITNVKVKHIIPDKKEIQGRKIAISPHEISKTFIVVYLHSHRY